MDLFLLVEDFLERALNGFYPTRTPHVWWTPHVYIGIRWILSIEQFIQNTDIQCVDARRRSRIGLANSSCLTRPMKGKICCRKHGGKSPSGAESDTAKHLRYSKAPKRMQEGIAVALEDEKLLELRQEAALLQERANDLLSRVDSGESGHLWGATKKTWDKYLKALRREDEDDVAEFRQYLNQLITMGDDDYSAWDDVYKVLDQKRRISESERKRMHDMELMIAANQIRHVDYGGGRDVPRQCHEACKGCR